MSPVRKPLAERLLQIDLDEKAYYRNTHVRNDEMMVQIDKMAEGTFSRKGWVEVSSPEVELFSQTPCYNVVTYLYWSDHPSRFGTGHPICGVVENKDYTLRELTRFVLGDINSCPVITWPRYIIELDNWLNDARCYHAYQIAVKHNGLIS